LSDKSAFGGFKIYWSLNLAGLGGMPFAQGQIFIGN
jgi:hypothetical protein